MGLGKLLFKKEQKLNSNSSESMDICSLRASLGEKHSSRCKVFSVIAEGIFKNVSNLKLKMSKSENLNRINVSKDPFLEMPCVSRESILTFLFHRTAC